MLTTRFGVGFLTLLIPLTFFSQETRKSIPATRANSSLKIDGRLDDAAWASAPIAKDFVMFEPRNGEAENPRQRTEVRVLYDDEAVYIGAMLYDSAPDSILTQLTQRDRYSENCDWFGFFINPYNDGLSDFNFWVTAAGTQADSRTTPESDDFSLNSVWKSAVQITGQGWIIEARIPYIALRFPETQVKDWGLNFMRSIRRSRGTYSWNFLDISSGNRLEYQCGLLTDVADIDPPIRLSAMPYVSAYVDDYGGETTTDFNAGLDLKYGLNESFTLDMTVIPDFGQVAYDQQFLNLSPFENRFTENRQFFTEGNELFSLGDLLYTRRIGGEPKNIQGIDLAANDSVEIRQEFTRLLNALKVSGRTKGNLGIGVLNAITDDNFTTRVEDGVETQVLTEPLTNYNVIALDQRIMRNSSISLVNTNVLRKGASRDANVTALLGTILTPSGNHGMDANAYTSMIFQGDSMIQGYRGKLWVGDIAGNWRWSIEEQIVTDDYDINDLGFQARSNFIRHRGWISYQTIQPVGVFNRIRQEITATYKTLYDPYRYEETVFEYQSFYLLRSFFAFGFEAATTPTDIYNYFEPRNEGRWFKTPQQNFLFGFISSDYRKTLALDARVGHFWWSRMGKSEWNIEVEPRVRLGDHFFATLFFRIFTAQNDFGYVTDNGADSVYFGRRNNFTVENAINARYVFNPVSSLSLTLRHTYTDVDYLDFHFLRPDANIHRTELDGIDDLNFNAFNIDLKYSWWFAPGSELVLLYRQAVASADVIVGESYRNNLENTFDSPVQNNLSIRLTYFLDYHSTRNQIKKLRSGRSS